MSITLAVLFAVPLLGLARVDLVGGAHLLLGRPAALRAGLLAVAAAIACFYFFTFLVNLPAGRMFCGFGCPIGQLSRFSDAIDAFPRDPRRRRRAWLELIAFATALSVAVGLWWVAPGELGRGRGGLLAVGAIGLVTVAAVLHGRYWRWGFCRKFCPIGLYYTVVQTQALIGVDFDPARTCTECGACATICPVALDPRRLDEEIASPGGLAFEGLPASCHCLHCGVCIDVCELMVHKKGGNAAMGFRRTHAAHAPSPEPQPEEAQG